MAPQRKSIDCRNYPSEKNCSLKISGTEQEVLDAAVQHAASTHGHENTPELREQIKAALKICMNGIGPEKTDQRLFDLIAFPQLFSARQLRFFVDQQNQRQLEQRSHLNSSARFFVD